LSQSVAKAAEVYPGATGLYLAGAVAGATHVDVIALSMANRATTTPERIKIATYSIVIAVISNTLLKAGMAAFIGAPAMRRTIVLVTLILFIAAVVVSLIA
jgi:uncharacterized membrane protein (DUF4010 family)